MKKEEEEERRFLVMVELKEKPVERFMLKVKTHRKKMQSTPVNRTRLVPMNNVRLARSGPPRGGSGGYNDPAAHGL